MDLCAGLQMKAPVFTVATVSNRFNKCYSYLSMCYVDLHDKDHYLAKKTGTRMFPSQGRRASGFVTSVFSWNDLAQNQLARGPVQVFRKLWIIPIARQVVA
jgi:hypothetical protein